MAARAVTEKTKKIGGIMQFGALQEDFDEWLASLEPSTQGAYLYRVLPSFKIDPNAYDIPTIPLWETDERVESADVVNVVLDTSLLSNFLVERKCSFMHTLSEISLTMPTFRTDIPLGEVYFEPETPIECNKLFEFFQPPPLEEDLCLDSRGSSTPTYLQSLNMVFAELPRIYLEVEAEKELGWIVESCTDKGDQNVPLLPVEHLLLEHYVPSDKNSYIKSLNTMLRVDGHWSIAKDVYLPCDQIMCDENMPDLDGLVLEGNYFIEPRTSCLFKVLPVLRIEDNAGDLLRLFEESPRFEEPEDQEDEFTSPNLVLPEMTFNVTSKPRKSPDTLRDEENTLLDGCTVMVNYGMLAEYKVMTELRKSGAHLIERDFNTSGARVIILSADHVLLLIDTESLLAAKEAISVMLGMFKFVWVAVMIRDVQHISKTVIKTMNSVAAMNIERCRFFIVQDRKDSCRLVGRIVNSENIAGTAEEALSAHERFLCKLDSRLNHFQAQELLAKDLPIRQLLSQRTKQKDDRVDLTRE